MPLNDAVASAGIPYRCIGAGSLRDLVLGRALLRRTGLLESPDAVLDDLEVVEHARNTQRILAAKTPRKVGPDDDELADILASHNAI